MADIIQIDNVGIVFVCARNRTAKITTRKFVAACGSKIEFSIQSGKVIKIVQQRERCRAGCKACAEQQERAIKVIETA